MPKKLAFIFVPAFLLAGLAAALGKMGLMPWAGSHFHGLLMLNGFTGGLITAEKVMARADGVRVSAYWLVVVGMLITLAGIEMASVFVAIAGLLLVWDELAHPAAGHRTDSLLHVLAFFCLTMANVKFFRTGFIPDAILFWQGFVVLMILSTRIKKMGASQSYTLLAGLIFYFISLWLPFHLVGQAITGGTLFVLAVWLFVREVRHSKAGSLMYGAAYFWLAVSGASMLLADQILYSFDFMIHSLFLGFLFSMIFLQV
ncbi:MAG: hypothetical protein OEY56_08480, partial [Cyclobacteriaceae bacterium]|nr:hypothetical protein [Cyclobacteriaceae bacterium]